MDKLTTADYRFIDRSIFAVDELVTYNAEIRDKVFNLVRAAGVDPHSIPDWSCCMGSAVELTGFLENAIEAVREKRNDE